MLLTNYDGRLANQTIQLLGYSILAEKLDLKIFGTSEFKIIEKFNLKIFDKGRVIKPDKNCLLTYGDDDLKLIMDDSFDTNHPINFVGNFQVGWFLKKYRKKMINMFNIKEVEKFPECSIYMMLRLGDVSFYAPPFTFYEKTIKEINSQYQNIENQKLFISTDSPYHPLVLYFVFKYKFKVIKDNSYNKILFGRKFNNLILTSGSFNFLTAIISEAKNIIYPEVVNNWHPNYYEDFEWKKIKLSWPSSIFIRSNVLIFKFLKKYFNKYRILLKRIFGNLISSF